MNKKFLLLTLLFISFLSFCLSAEIVVHSPVSGVWANKQLLYLETQNDAEYFYSVNGEDPSESGFAYDGPVFLDLSGNVKIRICRKNFDGTEESKTVEYTVRQNSGKESFKSLFTSFSKSGILSYSAGSVIDIPSEYSFSFEESPRSFISGRKISYSSSCILNRMIPCTISDGNLLWRFYIKTTPISSFGTIRNDIPFFIDNWERVFFTNDDMIYRVDNEYWASMQTVTLDRTKNHIIYWQPMAYEEGNPVEFLVLPPKPQLKTEIQKDRSVVFYLEGAESYAMNLSGNVNYDEIYPEFSIDTFYGDQVAAKAKINVYADSVYQGSIETWYDVNKKQPAKPEILSSANSFYTRGDVNLSISAWNNISTFGKTPELYVAVSEPFKINNLNKTYDSSNPLFQSIKPENFSLYDGRAEFVLPHVDEAATFYKVYAYSVTDGEKSEITEYSVIVDSFNYYFDSTGDSTLADGTAEHPFTGFEQCVNIVNQNKYARFFIRGAVALPEYELNLKCTVIAYGQENAEIVFKKNSLVTIENCTLQIKNIRMKTSDRSEIRNSALVTVKNGTLELNACEFISNFEKNGMLFKLDGASVKLKDTVLFGNAKDYLSMFNGADSTVVVEASRMNTVCDTAVCFSLRDSSLDLISSEFKLTGNMGRVCELKNSKANLTSNEFKGEFKTKSNSKTSSLNPVYADSLSVVTDENNLIKGF